MDSSELKVLIVDDYIEISTNLSAILAEHACAAWIACNGNEALKHARENRFDVVLLDYNMPDMDGLTMFGQIKRVQPNVEGILVSGRDRSELLEQAIGAGIWQVLQKPVRFADLLEHIHQAAEKTAANERRSDSSP